MTTYRAWIIPRPPGSPRWSESLTEAYELLLRAEFDADAYPYAVSDVHKWEPALDDWYDLDGDEDGYREPTR